MLAPRPAQLLRPSLETERQLLGYRLLREGNAELARLRVTRGAHRRTARRIQRALAVVALAASLLGIPLLEQSDAAGRPGFGTPVASPHGLGLPAGQVVSVPAFVDIDDDGDLDAFIGASSGEIFFQRNTGGADLPAFALPTTSAFGLSDIGQSAAPSFADIDKDGDFDALVGSESGNLHFFRNTGSKSSPMFLAASTNAFQLADVGAAAVPTFADIDRDGDLDVFVGRKGGDVVFFRNTGTASSASFAAPQVDPFDWPLLGTPDGRIAPRFEDLDGDEDLDGLVGFGSGGLALFENTGSKMAPAFDEPQFTPFCLSLDAGMILPAPAFEDIDGDGDRDLLLGAASGHVPLFENTGVATLPVFVSPFNAFGLDIAYAAFPRFVDIDSDGDLDALVGAASGNTYLFLNTGSSASPDFSSPFKNPFGLARVSFDAAPALVDIDDDGDLDAFIGDNDGNTTFFRNTSTTSEPAFGPGSTNAFGLTSVLFDAAPILVDIDDDGDLDAFIGESIGGSTVFFENTGTTTSPMFASASSNPFGLAHAGSQSQAKPFFADLDGDEDLDALIGTGSGSTFFFENTGSSLEPAFASATFLAALRVRGSARPTLVDIDGDEDLDAFIGMESGSTLFLGNEGSASEPSFANNSLGIADVYFLAQPAFADIDADGDPDAFVSGTLGSTLFLKNIGTASAPAFAMPETNPFGLMNIDLASPTFADIDDDGDFDAFFGERYGNTLFFENTGTASMPSFDSPLTNPFNLVDVDDQAKPAFVDIDGDGDLDAFIGAGFESPETEMLFFENTLTASEPSFAAPVTDAFGLPDVYFARPSFADLDGDGDFDALFGEWYGDLIFFKNTGTASAAKFDAPATNPFGLSTVSDLSAPALVDIDTDGDVDVFVGNVIGRTYFFENTSGPPMCGDLDSGPILVEPEGECQSKPNCFFRVQDGLDAATDGVTVRVARTFFNENVEVDLSSSEAVTLEGGWDAAFEMREDSVLAISPGTVADRTTVRSMKISGGIVRLAKD